MSLKTSINYRAPRNAIEFNEQQQDVVRPGLYTGGAVVNGGGAGLFSIAAFVAFTADGVRIESDGETDFNSGSPISTNPGPETRRDYVVVEYEFAQTLPVPVPLMKVIEGAGTTPPTLTATQYRLATLLVPSGSNVPDQIIAEAQKAELQNVIVVGDGITANGERNGVEEIQRAIDDLNAAGGGVVRLVGTRFGQRGKAMLTLKSNVVIDGGDAAKISGDGDPDQQDYVVYCRGHEGRTGTISGGNTLTDDTPGTIDFALRGVGSIVEFTSGPHSGEKYLVKDVISGAVVELESLHRKPVTLTNGGSNNFDLRVANAGVRGLTIDGEGMDPAASVLHFRATEDCVIENVVGVNESATAVDTFIELTLDHVGLRIRDVRIYGNYNNGIEALAGDHEGTEIVNVESEADITVTPSGGFNLHYSGNRVTGGATETLNAQVGNASTTERYQEIVEFAKKTLHKLTGGYSDVGENGLLTHYIDEGPNLLDVRVGFNCDVETFTSVGPFVGNGTTSFYDESRFNVDYPVILIRYRIHDADGYDIYVYVGQPFSVDGTGSGATAAKPVQVAHRMGDTLGLTDPFHDLAGAEVKNAADPTAAQSLATKNYVDTEITAASSTLTQITASGSLSLGVNPADVPGLTAALAAGTYLVIGQFDTQTSKDAGDKDVPGDGHVFYLHDGTSSIQIGTGGGVANLDSSTTTGGICEREVVTCQHVLVLGSTKTVKLQAKRFLSSTGLVEVEATSKMIILKIA